MRHVGPPPHTPNEAIAQCYRKAAIALEEDYVAWPRSAIWVGSRDDYDGRGAYFACLAAHAEFDTLYDNCGAENVLHALLMLDFAAECFDEK